MKKYLILLMLQCALVVYGQTKQVKHKIPILDQARMRVDVNHFLYNPVQGFELYLKAALDGDHRAMNAVAILYSDGMGTAQNKETGFEWFKKSAESGYSRAWANLGWCYARGLGTTQDFEKAFAAFSEGTKVNSFEAKQGKGYLLYKGFGCQQNYKEAVGLFKQGVRGGVLASMYFLGLSYRNGYGISVNIDSARYWLQKAYGSGYSIARDELENPKPEYDEKGEKKAMKVSLASFVQQNRIDRELIPVSPLEPAMAAGEYKGFAIRYDWSGQYIISKTPLKLTLHRNGSLISGNWNEGGQTTAEVQAILDERGMSFKGTAYKRQNQYSQKRAIPFEFRNAALQAFKQGDSVFLIGNVRLWDVENNEPERPLYISLSRYDSGTSELAAAKGLTAYPNPFNQTLQVVLTLEKPESVKLILANMSGQVVYSGTVNLEAGRQVHSIKPDLPPGSYILKATYDGQVKTVIVIKN